MEDRVDQILREFYEGIAGSADIPPEPDPAAECEPEYAREYPNPAPPLDSAYGDDVSEGIAADYDADDEAFYGEDVHALYGTSSKPDVPTPEESIPVPSESSVSDAKKSEKASLLSECYEWLEVVVTAIVAIVLIFVFFARTIEVIGPSMQNTLHDKDRIVLSGLFYTPKAGDIVVLRKRDFKDGIPIIKRIIATEGQTINIDFDIGAVYVDGKLMDEPYIRELTHNQINFEGPVEVPEGCVFVMGDNRNDSSDSRDNRIGMVDKREILGRLLFRLLPLNKFGAVD